MRYLKFLPILLLFVAFPELSAGNNASSANKAAAAAAAKRQALLDELKKKDEERTALAQQYYSDVHSAVPSVTVDDIKRMSPTEIRELYVKSYVAQGTQKVDAINKAAALKIYGQ